MALEYYINDIRIPESDLLREPVINDEFIYDSNMAASTMELILDNTDPTKYDDRYTTSIFYGLDFYGKEVLIIDIESEYVKWRGTISGLEVDAKQVKVKSDNAVMRLAQTVCVYSSNTDKTAVEIMYDIAVSVAGIPEEQILLAVYNAAKTIQEANQVFFNVEYTLEDNVKCLHVINELRRITQCEPISHQNTIEFRQWQPWTGEEGIDIDDSWLEVGKYKHWTDREAILNSYNIKYLDGSAIGEVSGSDASSVSKFGSKPFLVPTSDQGTVPAGFKILSRNATGATWCGSLALQRYKSLKKFCSISFLQDPGKTILDEIINLTTGPLNREPCLVTGYVYQNSLHQVTAQFLNLIVDE